MDAFSVSIANGIVEPEMKTIRMLMMAGIYAAFQFIMPMLGWILVTTLEEMFTKFSILIPWIALILLLFIGGKMLVEGIKEKKLGNKDGKDKVMEARKLTWGALMIQGVATSIDALSVGFTIAEHDLISAIVAALIIAVVTFFICMGGIFIGRKAGTRLAGKAGILGGIILIFIGLEIFITSWF
jgi:putative Mn2+ efflux pump MntP